MRSGIIAQKLGMTRIFTDAGDHVPVTVLKVEGCQVVAHRTQDKNGYTAIMYAVMLWHWPAIDVLLAHGARLDHVGDDGHTLRDLVAEKHERLHDDLPPELTRLEARLH